MNTYSKEIKKIIIDKEINYTDVAKTLDLTRQAFYRQLKSNNINIITNILNVLGYELKIVKKDII